MNHADAAEQHTPSSGPLHLEMRKDGRERWARRNRGVLRPIARRHRVSRSYVSQVLHGRKRDAAISRSLDRAIERTEPELHHRLRLQQAVARGNWVGDAIPLPPDASAMPAA